jgi:hypothetical protein
MALFNYTPNSYKLPELPKIQTASNVQIPKTQINNNYAKSILDSLGNNIKAPQAYTSQFNINDTLYPTQELGNQFIQQNLLPEFQRDTLNPYQRQMANRSASSNLSLLGNNKRYMQDSNRRVTQPFYDQANQVQDIFNNQSFDNLDDSIRSYYASQFNF